MPLKDIGKYRRKEISMSLEKFSLIIPLTLNKLRKTSIDTHHLSNFTIQFLIQSWLKAPKVTRSTCPGALKTSCIGWPQIRIDRSNDPIAFRLGQETRDFIDLSQLRVDSRHPVWIARAGDCEFRPCLPSQGAVGGKTFSFKRLLRSYVTLALPG